MIQEDYVSLETAKLLKTKGFNEECDNAYFNGTLVDYTMFGFCIGDELLSSPTHQMTLKWLREEHECPIEILWHWDADNQQEEWYFQHHMELKPVAPVEYYDTYEEATEAAIKYCLNLIDTDSNLSYDELCEKAEKENEYD